MCGIVGLSMPGWNRDALALCLELMNEAQVHRGPDGEGAFADPDLGVAIGMRRLAILDVAGGVQPMASDDGRYLLVYNGEILNAPDLRRELECEGERFVTDHSDTEVLLRLLVRQGIAALPRLNGMFAFALLDRFERTLTLGRDRFGIKPLYYTDTGGRFAFASELKSLLRLPFVQRAVDQQSLFHYLSLMYVPGQASILDGVARLPPGHTLVYRLEDRASRIQRWWQIGFLEARGDEGDWPARIRERLARAVERWTLSDTPVACSLSGGLDSSAIVGLLASRGHRLSTYSLGFGGAGEQSWNELPLARLVAQKWGCAHHEIVMRPQDLLADLGQMAFHMDEPYGGGLPSWAVFKAMSKDVKVGLVGSGGDELFGNYGKWRDLEPMFQWPWAGRPDRDAFTQKFFERYYYFPDEAKRRAMPGAGDAIEDTSAFLFARFDRASGSIRDRCATTDIETQLADEFLTMTDRFSMAHSLEARPPFLDNELVDLVRSIPSGQRTHRRDLKGLLRQAAAPVLPPELLHAPKKGFVIPLKLWLRNELRPLTERLLAPERLRRQGLFAPSLFEEHVRPHLDGHADMTTRVWGLLMFQIWHAMFIEHKLTAAPSGLSALEDLV